MSPSGEIAQIQAELVAKLRQLADQIESGDENDDSCTLKVSIDQDFNGVQKIHALIQAPYVTAARIRWERSAPIDLNADPASFQKQFK